MPNVGPESIPGTVAVPTWVLIAAIVALFGAREWERKRWFDKMDVAREAMDRLSQTVKDLTAVIVAQRKRRQDGEE